MSFSGEVKKEIARVGAEKECCAIALAAGFFRACGSLKPGGGGEIGLVMGTGIPAVARAMKLLCERLLGGEGGLFVTVADTGGRGFSRRIELNLPPSREGADLLLRAGVIERRDGLLAPAHGIPASVWGAKCCRKSFLRGLFLGAGSVADPAKRYHFEVVLGDASFAGEARRLLSGFSGIDAGVFARAGKYVVYVKAAEQVKDVLGILGAHLHLLAFEDARARHELRERANRFSNCDNANLDRQAGAAYGQLQAIEAIEAGLAGGVAGLPPKLREAAAARLANPSAGLAELGGMFCPPVGKPATAARFARIARLAQGLSRC